MAISNQKVRRLSADSSYSTASSIGYESDEEPQRAKKLFRNTSDKQGSSNLEKNLRRNVQEENKRLRYQAHTAGNVTVTRESLQQTNIVKHEESSANGSLTISPSYDKNIYQQKVKIP